MTDIFISYATEDRESLRHLRELLETQGWSVFWDEQTQAGKNWRRNIFEHLRTARCVIVAWSSASVESDWVPEEAADALKRHVLLPVFIERVEPPFGFADVQALNLVDWNGAEDSEPFRRLVDEIAEILDARSPAANNPRPKSGGTAGITTAGRLPLVVGVVALLIVLVGISLWFYERDPSLIPRADQAVEPMPPDVSVGGDGIAVGRDLNHTGDIKFGD